MLADEITEKFKKESGLIADNFKKEIAFIRGNRPTPALVEDLKVDYFGQSLTVKQLASINIAPPREIDLNVWDKNAVPGVAKAIEAAGLSANIEGKLLRINLPVLTEERRQVLIKEIKKIAEKFRIQLRHSRDEINKTISQLLGEKKIGEDQKFLLKEEIQKRTDDVGQEIEKILEKKIEELRKS